MYQNIPTKVLTGEVRLSYANLTAPRAVKQGAEPKYSVTLLIPKSDGATVENIRASIEAATVEAIGKVWNGVRPPVVPNPLHDGDGVRESGIPYGKECHGHWVMTASSKNKPEVVHMSDINTTLAPQDIYSGMYARVTLNFFGYMNSGKKGVGCGLGNVMKTREGEPLAGGASAASDFADVGSTAASYGAQAAYQPYTPAYSAQAAYQPQINPVTGQPEGLPY